MHETGQPCLRQADALLPCDQTRPAPSTSGHGVTPLHFQVSGTVVTAATGADAEQWRGRDLLDLAPPPAAERLRIFLLPAVRTTAPARWQGLVTRDGRVGVLERTLDGFLWHRRGGPCPEWFDQDALRTRLRLHEAIADHGWWISDPQQQRMRLSQRASHLLGLAAHSGWFGLQAVLQRLSPDDARLVEEGLGYVHSQLRPHFTLDVLLQLPSVDSQRLRIDGRRACLDSGRTGVIGRIRRPHRNCLEQQTLQGLFSGSPDIIGIFDARSEILDIIMAPGFLGWTADTFRGSQDWTHNHPDDRPQVVEGVTKLFQHEIDRVSVLQRISTRDGAWRWLHCVGRLLQLPDGREVMVGNHWDIDHLKRAELEIHQQRNDLDRTVTERTLELTRANALLRQREGQLVRGATLQALGTLVAGVIHEIAAPLGTCELGLLVAQRGLDEVGAGAANDALTRAHAALRHALDVVAHLRDAVRDRPMASFATVDLNGIIDSAVALLHPTLQRSGVHLERVVPAQPVLAFISPRQLIQALVNLLLNAVQSLPPPGGTVRVTLASDEAGHQLTISDTGCGMDEQVRRRVGEPFFTTHGESGALGLGISVTLGIVREHGGRLDFSSSAGAGTTVTLVLPHSNSAKQLP